MNQFLKKYFSLLVTGLLILSCNEWDDHNAIRDGALNKTLTQVITGDPELSKFSEYLKSTGYDEILASSKTYTVWAPTNDALAGLDAGIVSDPDKLKQFVGNHISYQEYFTTTPVPNSRVKMLNGKYNTWDGTKIEGTNLVSSNEAARNGVLHVINGNLVPHLNDWELLINSGVAQKQAAFLQALTYEEFVDSLATEIGIDPNTGKPIYEEGTGIVVRNTFLDEVADIDNEDSVYTFILLTDEAFDNEVTKLLPYFKTATMDQDSIEGLASWHLTRDLVFRGRIDPEDLPDTVISQFGVKVPIDKNAIEETYSSSNGIVYVMSAVDFRIQDKILPIAIEGEKPTAFSRTDKNLYIHYRYREWASQFFDLRIRDHSVALFNVRYKVDYVYSTSYHVYWRAVNDWTTASHQQRLMIGSPTANTFPYVTVTPSNFDEIYLGDYTVDKFGYINLYLVSANSSNNALNPLVLDYIKLVPVF